MVNAQLMQASPSFPPPASESQSTGRAAVHVRRSAAAPSIVGSHEFMQNTAMIIMMKNLDSLEGKPA
jgi:hypothetical protein